MSGVRVHVEHNMTTYSGYTPLRLSVTHVGFLDLLQDAAEVVGLGRLQRRNVQGQGRYRSVLRRHAGLQNRAFVLRQPLRQYKLEYQQLRFLRHRLPVGVGVLQRPVHRYELQ